MELTGLTLLISGLLFGAAFSLDRLMRPVRRRRVERNQRAVFSRPLASLDWYCTETNPYAAMPLKDERRAA